MRLLGLVGVRVVYDNAARYYTLVRTSGFGACKLFRLAG